MIPLYLLPLTPFLGGLLLLLGPSRRERWIQGVSLVTSMVFTLLVLLSLGWLAEGQLSEFSAPLFHWESYHFHLSLKLDSVASVFLFMTALLGGLVVRLSQEYMHREPGQRRFFSTLLFFLAGMTTVILANDIDTLFMAWEVVGISSFLLIGFYRHREAPVRNALKVFCIYRLCDVGLLASAFLQHRELGTASFSEIGQHRLPPTMVLPITLLLLLSAMGKSAQFPFSFWVARAMEGPTPSSAIFYGALSIHAGVFLLLRTAPLWQSSLLCCGIIAAVGLITALLASLIGQVQSNIKAQIAYSSVTQVALMFIELALGWHDLVLIHFVGNASLRCYQLLISPSVVAYLLQQQSKIQGHQPDRPRPTHRWPTSLYVLATQEAYMESLVNVLFRLPQWFARHVMGENQVILVVWTRSLLFSLSLALLIGLESSGLHQAIPFVLGITLSYGLGLLGILTLPRDVRSQTLDRLHGLSDLYPGSTRLIFFSFLGMSGFPITPAFFGEDLLLSSATQVHPGLALAFTFLFIINGMVLARTFTRLCLGYEVVRWEPELTS